MKTTTAQVLCYVVFYECVPKIATQSYINTYTYVSILLMMVTCCLFVSKLCKVSWPANP